MRQMPGALTAARSKIIQINHYTTSGLGYHLLTTAVNSVNPIQQGGTRLSVVTSNNIVA